jgi:hypothetical protein
MLAVLPGMEILFKRNKPITQADIARVCAKAGLSFGRIK